MSTTDHAGAVVTAVLQTIRQALERDQELRAALVEILCDEFDDIKRATLNEIRESE